MVKTQTGIYTILITFFVFGVYMFERSVENGRRKQLVYRVMFGLYGAAVVWITLLSRQPQNGRTAFLMPLQSYAAAYGSYMENVAAAAKDGVVTAIERVRSFLYGYNWLILNVLLFVPYGVLAPKTMPKTRSVKLFLYGAFGSAVIELTQYCFRLGCFDVDDLIQNAVGIGVGYLLACLLKPDQGAVRKKSEQRCGE